MCFPLTVIQLTKLISFLKQCLLMWYDKIVDTNISPINLSYTFSQVHRKGGVTLIEHNGGETHEWDTYVARAIHTCWYEVPPSSQFCSTQLCSKKKSKVKSRCNSPSFIASPWPHHSSPGAMSVASFWLVAKNLSACQNFHAIFPSLLKKHVLSYVSMLISFVRLFHCQNHSDDMLLGWKHNCVLFISCSPLFWAISLFNTTTTTHRAFHLNVKQY